MEYCYVIILYSINSGRIYTWKFKLISTYLHVYALLKVSYLTTEFKVSPYNNGVMHSREKRKKYSISKLGSIFNVWFLESQQIPGGPLLLAVAGYVFV